MGKFSTDTLRVETADGQHFVLLEGFTFTRDDGCVITVPPGSASDGASTPRPLWIHLPPFGKYWMAAFLHDHLYRDTDLPKDYCDDTFLQAMRCLGVDEITATTIYEGVHIGGWSAYRDDRETHTY